MTAYRFHVGRDVSLVNADGMGVEVEGRSRLPPGRVVRLTGVTGAGQDGRLAIVATWRVIRLGQDAPIYRGYCEWIDSGRRT